MSVLDTQFPGPRGAWAAKRKAIQPKAVSVSEGGLVRVGELREGHPLPLLITPALPGVSLRDWVAHNLDYVERALLEHGGILFRGFGLRTQEDFAAVMGALPIELMHYIEGATPRVEIGNKVYTSTEFPSDQTIQLHNELCYVTTWPMKICFYCVRPADEGGETPIGDVRRVYKRLSPEVREKFERLGWMLMRNFSEGLGLPWQRSFRAQTREEVEEYFRRARVGYEWLEGGRLRTRQVRQAVAHHPVTGEAVWFNHVAFWHVSSLREDLRQMLLEAYGEDGLPYNTYYGDGSRIEDEVAAELRAAYVAETESFLWERGDVMLLDNMLAAHGRGTFKGERKILVSMGQPHTGDGLVGGRAGQGASD